LSNLVFELVLLNRFGISVQLHNGEFHFENHFFLVQICNVGLKAMILLHIAKNEQLLHLEMDDFSVIEDDFKTYDKEFQVDLKSKEEIDLLVFGLEGEEGKLASILMQIHQQPTEEKLSGWFLKLQDELQNVKTFYSSLAKVVSSDRYYRYHELFRHITQKIVCVAAILIFFTQRHLLTRSEAAEILGVAEREENGFHLDLEDYLHAILLSTSEFCRFAVNFATFGHYERVDDIADILGKISAAFRLLNFKSGNLRKHYDTLKYSLNKVEEVKYNLTIRGLRKYSEQEK
ncbi:Translin, partial [Trichinella murrelli]